MATIEEEKKHYTLVRLKCFHAVNLLASTLTMNARMEAMLSKMTSLQYSEVVSKDMIYLMISRMLTSPLLSSMSDVFGREIIIRTILTFQVLQNVVQTASPTIGIMQWCSRLGFLTMGPYIQMASTSVADIFVMDPKRAVIEQGKLGLSFVLSSFCVPTLVRMLFPIDVRLPFLVSALIHFSELIVRFLPQLSTETLPIKDRKCLADINLLDWNPFQFLKLFTTGKKLCALAIMETIQMIVNGPSFARIASVIRIETYGKNAWNLSQRSWFQTCLSVSMVPGVLLSGNVYRAYGPRVCVYFCNLFECVRQFSLQFLTRPWQEYMAVPFVIIRNPGNTAVQASMRIEAKKQGLSNSELQGAMTNLTQIVMMTSGILLNRLLRVGMRRNHPRLIYRYLSLVPAVNAFIFYHFVDNA